MILSYILHYIVLCYASYAMMQLCKGTQVWAVTILSVSIVSSVSYTPQALF